MRAKGTTMNETELLNTVRASLEWDGSLRDIYVLTTDLTIWTRFWKVLEASKLPCRLTVGGEEYPWPDDPGALHDMSGEQVVLLSIRLGGATVNCHFFTEQEIELDLDPRELPADEDILRLTHFMALVGDGLQREVLLTYENGPEGPIVRYSPNVGFIDGGLLP